MPTYRIRHVLPYVTLLPRDVAVNTFHAWSAAELDAEQLDELAATFIRFYTDVTGNPSGQPLGAWISTQVSRDADACRTEVYSLADPEPRVPQLIVNWTMSPAQTGAGVANLPLECAVVNSFQGALVAGLPQRRRRGRIFFGPLRTSASTGANPPVVQPNLRSDLIFRSSTLRDETITEAGCIWVVWSEVDQNPVNITNGWVDDDMDTQRRRGLRAITRSTWSA